MVFFFFSAIGALLFLATHKQDLLSKFIFAFGAGQCFVFGHAVVILGHPPESIGSLVSRIQVVDIDLTPQTWTAALMLISGVVSMKLHRPNISVNNQFGSLPKAPAIVVWPFLIIGILANFIVIAFTGLDNLWESPGYGFIKESWRIFSENPLLGVLARTQRMATLIAIGFMVGAIQAKDRFVTILCVFIILMGILFSLAESSRFLVILLLALSASSFVLGKKFLSLILLILGGLSLVYVLEARAHYYQGISHFFDYLVIAFDGGSTLFRLLNNFLGGLFIFSASLKSGSPESYTSMYKILSFSPTINQIDNFQYYKRLSEQRVFAHVPFSTFVEAWLFGIGYFIFLWGVIIGSATIIQRFKNRLPAIYYLSVALFVLGLVYATQYPIRNSIRYFYLAALVTISFSYFQTGKTLSSRFGKK
mgnify:CR=1 FL=1